MIRKTLIAAATLALTVAGAAAANAATYGVGGASQNKTMIQQIHDDYGHHEHGRRFDDGRRWGPQFAPKFIPRCAIVRNECSNYFRPGSFRWDRCLARRGC